MKKGYFINCMSYKSKDELEISGVFKKVAAQCRVLGQHTNLIHELHNMYGKYARPIDKLIRRLPFTGISERWKYHPKYAEADFIYFRKDVIDYSVYSFLRTIKQQNPKIKILFEIPTYPYDSEIKRGLKTIPFYWKDVINRKKLHLCVDRIVTLSQDDEIFGIKTIRIINGFDFNTSEVANFNLLKDEINLIAVSTFAFWHGYDRFLRGLGEYYKKGGKRNIIFHMVGDGVEIPLYKQIIKEYGIKEHVILHGSKSGAELDAIYDMCCLGVESLGAHRKDISYSSSLKSREYGAKGLPIITSIPIDYIPNDYKYQLNIPADDSPVDMVKVLEFYDKIYEKDPPQKVAHSIREFAKVRCDINITMKPVIDYIMEETGE